MQNSRRLTVVAIVVVIVSLLWWAFPKRDRVEASAVADSSSSPFAERTIVLPGSDVELSPRYLGTLSSRTDSAFATKLAAGMQAAKTGAGAVPQRREPRTQNEIPEHLLPKAPDLSDEQRANLLRCQKVR